LNDIKAVYSDVFRERFVRVDLTGHYRQPIDRTATQ
jgi:hypothetical protein